MAELVPVESPEWQAIRIIFVFQVFFPVEPFAGMSSHEFDRPPGKEIGKFPPIVGISLEGIAEGSLRRG